MLLMKEKASRVLHIEQRLPFQENLQVNLNQKPPQLEAN